MDPVETISLNDLVPQNHSYRQFIELWSFNSPQKQLRRCVKANPHKGFGLLRWFKCLLLQFMENLSDRKSVFCHARKRIGTQVLSKIFFQLKQTITLGRCDE